MSKSLTQTRIKICGITSVEDAVLAADNGADAIGIVFYEPSPRHVADLALARDIAFAAGPYTTVVALTVNASKEYVEAILEQVPVNVIQFHGDETDEFCRQFNRPFVKAIRVQSDLDIEAEISRYPSSSGVLLDTYVKGVPGGTGEVFNWELVPARSSKPIVLAGGLTPDNVQTAIARTQVYGVDVSGGVEASPGIKDPNKIKAFIKNAQSE